MEKVPLPSENNEKSSIAKWKQRKKFYGEVKTTETVLLPNKQRQKCKKSGSNVKIPLTSEIPLT